MFWATADVEEGSAFIIAVPEEPRRRKNSEHGCLIKETSE
jgi:hypothetical protein